MWIYMHKFVHTQHICTLITHNADRVKCCPCYWNVTGLLCNVSSSLMFTWGLKHLSQFEQYCAYNKTHNAYYYNIIFTAITSNYPNTLLEVTFFSEGYLAIQCWFILSMLRNKLQFPTSYHVTILFIISLSLWTKRIVLFPTHLHHSKVSSVHPHKQLTQKRLNSFWMHVQASPAFISWQNVTFGLLISRWVFCFLVLSWGDCGSDRCQDVTRNCSMM